MNAVVLSPEQTISTPAIPIAGPKPAQMLMILVERGADLPTMEKFMAMVERERAYEAEMAYNDAMNRFKEDPPVIVKDKHVCYKRKDGGVVEYDHPTLGGICRAIIARMASFGLTHSWKYRQSEGKVKVVCRVKHTLGHCEETELHSDPDDSGGKNSIQAVSSAVTYLERYTLLGAVGFAPVNDDDGRGDGLAAAGVQPDASLPPREKSQAKGPNKTETAKVSPCTAAQARIIAKKLSDAGLRETDFLKQFRVGAISELKFAQVDEALQWIQRVKP